MDQHIDDLLARYLTLLDEYSKLRQLLSRLQSDVYQSIARANFAGERGMRYGQDHYDERMRALRVVHVEAGEAQVPLFRVCAAAAAEEEESEAEKQRVTEKKQSEAEKQRAAEEKQSESDTPRRKREDPLHWFGLLVPSALRVAQSQSVRAVEEVIPRLVSVDAEMLSVEIEIRRARKRRARAASKESIGVS